MGLDERASVRAGRFDVGHEESKPAANPDLQLNGRGVTTPLKLFTCPDRLAENL